jgi:hypothetical protein
VIGIECLGKFLPGVTPGRRAGLDRMTLSFVRSRRLRAVSAGPQILQLR